MTASPVSSPMSNEATYEIFRKEADNTTIRIESVKGIEEARKRLRELNATGPGEHFIFDPVRANAIEPSEPTVIKDPFDP
jgi:hypothetical protein